MVSIKVKFQRPGTGDCRGVVFYQVCCDGKKRKIPSGISLHPVDWDFKRSAVKLGEANETADENRLEARKIIATDLRRLTRIVSQREEQGLLMTADDIVNEFSIQRHDFTLFNFIGQIISKLKKNGRERTSETYNATLRIFSLYRRGNDIMLDRIDSDMMEDFEAWLIRRGVVQNTVSFYMRILRAVYNRAVDNGLTEDLKPFRNVYTGIAKTVKRALPLSAVCRINALNLNDSPALDYARDIFMLSFMLRGMSFIDMAFLRKTDLCSGYVSYRRRKTGRRLAIKWSDPMQKILDKYSNDQSSSYLLPILKDSAENPRAMYLRIGARINSNLKKIGRLIESDIPLTLYVARHSWASAARSKGIALSVISEGLGHESESPTQIYLASLDTTVVDRANSLILSALK